MAIRFFNSVVGVHCTGTIFSRIGQLVAYADDSNIIGYIKWDLTADFNSIERESTDMSQEKTMYMLSKSLNMRRIGSHMTNDNYTFDVVKEFV